MNSGEVDVNCAFCMFFVIILQITGFLRKLVLYFVVFTFCFHYDKMILKHHVTELVYFATNYCFPLDWMHLWST